MLKLINKIDCKYQTSSFGFRPNNGTMSLHLYGWKSLFKSIHKATMPLNHLLWRQAVLSESWKHSNNLRMLFFFIKNSVKGNHVSLGFLIMQTLYINNVFSIPIAQYFIDTLQNILKYVKVFKILYLITNLWNIFHHVILWHFTLNLYWSPFLDFDRIIDTANTINVKFQLRLF